MLIRQSVVKLLPLKGKFIKGSLVLLFHLLGEQLSEQISKVQLAIKSDRAKLFGKLFVNANVRGEFLPWSAHDGFCCSKHNFFQQQVFALIEFMSTGYK